jgi:formylglycine-generating enzyme required for sulfatase activity
MKKFLVAVVLSIFSLSSLCSFAQDQPQSELLNSIGMKLRLIPAGIFKHGSPVDEKGSNDDERQFDVTISSDFYLAVTEVTQAQFEKVMGKNPSYFQGQTTGVRHPETGRLIEDFDSSNHPVEQVSWEDATEFCKRLSLLPQEKASGYVYRLPSEAEWEFACRAGSQTAFHFGGNIKNLRDFGWFGNNSGAKTIDTEAIWDSSKGDAGLFWAKLLENGCRTHEVGSKKPNQLELFDMHGNVWEWTADWYGDYPRGAVVDPQGPTTGNQKVLRGGGWGYAAKECRSAERRGAIPTERSYGYGFRIALSPKGNQ